MEAVGGRGVTRAHRSLKNTAAAMADGGANFGQPGGDFARVFEVKYAAEAGVYIGPNSRENRDRILTDFDRIWLGLRGVRVDHGERDDMRGPPVSERAGGGRLGPLMGFWLLRRAVDS